MHSIKKKVEKYIQYILCCIFVAVTTVLCYINYSSFSANWDLGDFVQLFWYTVHGMPFKETATPFFSNTFPSNLQVSFLAIHFSPIIIVAAPFYAIYPSTITLFVVGSSILAAGSIPVYYLAYERISSRLAAVSFQISYLVHPAILFSSLHGFSPEFFLAPLGVTCFYFLLKRKLIYFFLSSLLLASVIEEAGIIAIILAGTWLLVYRKSIKAKEFLALILVAATVAIYVKFAFYARVSVFGLDENGVTSLISKENWSILGVQVLFRFLPGFLNVLRVG